MSGSAVPGTVSDQLVETMRALAGSHPGFRPVHAKGIVCSGTFRGAPEARALCLALHFQGQAVPATIRFANANGNPDVHDGLANVRSLAVSEVRMAAMPQPMSTPTAAGATAPFIAITLPTVAPFP